MTHKFILITLFAAGLSSCSAVYKMQQTPDDVYYSPAPRREEYVQVTDEEERGAYTPAENSSYGSGSYWEDRALMRRINNPRLRNYNFDYGYGSGYGFAYPYSYPLGYPYGFGSYYPYAYAYPVYAYPVYAYPKTGYLSSTYKAPRRFNLGTYTRPPVTTYTIDGKTGRIRNTTGSYPARTAVRPPANNGSGVGNLIRRVFTNPGGAGNSGINNSSSQSRSFEPSSRSSSISPSSGGSRPSGGSNAPVRTFRNN